MSSFGSKRKARVIKVSDEPSEEVAGDGEVSMSPGKFSDAAQSQHLDLMISSSFADEESSNYKADIAVKTTESPLPTFGSRAGRKPFRQSGLRKKVASRDDEDVSSADATKPDEEESDGPQVVRPNFGRNASSGLKKRQAKSSKLSFGAGAGNDEDDTGPDVRASKKESLSKKVLENSAVKRGISTRGLPVRSVQDDEDRPRYSKEYLSELQSSTPNTPGAVSSVPGGSADEMELDASELEGALIVESPSVVPLKSDTKVLTEAEIREKKERRARLAKEQDFISLEDDDDNDYTLRKKKDDTRLKPEDEEMGEGFDDFVEDGGLSLGKRAERERSKRDRKQMAEMINAAEGHSSDSSADSDAEGRMAYEAAQTRAGLDGLKKKPKKDANQELLQIPSKITPLPSLSECVANLRVSLQGMQSNMNEKAAKLANLRAEKEEIAKRQAEVQALLDETGKKYQEAMGLGAVDPTTVKSTGPGAEMLGERGLESLGATPSRAEEVQNIDDL
jgi:hypothetical protein